MITRKEIMMENKTKKQLFYSTTEVAKICQVTAGTVIRWIREGHLNSATTMGGHNRVPGEDLVALLKKLKMPIPPELSENSSSRAKKILIVDDDKAICDMLVNFFQKKFPDVTVECSYDGFSAGIQALKLSPDLIILDLKLPQMDGLSVCRYIRTLPELSHTKIIGITGFSEEQEEKMLEFGADDFMGKPFDMEKFKVKVAQHLGVTIE